MLDIHFKQKEKKRKEKGKMKQRQDAASVLNQFTIGMDLIGVSLIFGFVRRNTM